MLRFATIVSKIYDRLGSLALPSLSFITSKDQASLPEVA
jgi:hypothetical protein